MKRQKKKKVTKKMDPDKKSDDKKTGSNSEKVFDIAGPGKSMPSASSRPLIVTHKPNVEDPMVSPKNTEPEKANDEKGESPSAGEGADMIMSAPKKNRIEPLHTDVVPEDTHAEIPEGDEHEIAEEDSQTSEESSEEQKDSAQPEEDDGASEEISDIANEITTKKEAQSEAAKKEAEAAKRQAEVDALVNNKQFFVPINAVQKRRSMTLIIVIVLLALLAVGFLAALDAEILNIGIEPITDIL